eukprot:365891-Chlamydomonas_euryale.AAC.2
MWYYGGRAGVCQVCSPPPPTRPALALDHTFEGGQEAVIGREAGVCQVCPPPPSLTPFTPSSHTFVHTRTSRRPFT